jgi:hypothetical protein
MSTLNLGFITNIYTRKLNWGIKLNPSKEKLKFTTSVYNYIVVVGDILQLKVL